MNRIYMAAIYLSVLTVLTGGCARDLTLDNWTYVQVDNDRAKYGDWGKPGWLRYFGVDTADITGDGYKEIASGRYLYKNPGGDMTAPWSRIDLGVNVDAILFVDVDGDKYGDIIAQALPDVYWLEAENAETTAWKAIKVASVPKTDHTNCQGYRTAQIISGGKPEIILAAGDGTYFLSIPDAPEGGNWPAVQINKNNSGEGIGVGDIDGDGDTDITVGHRKDGKGPIDQVAWYENPGDGKGDWKQHFIGVTISDADRHEVADINGDGLADVAVSEERWPGKEPDGHLFWFERKKDGAWDRHLVVTQYSMNNLDAADLDGDGDIDLVTSEHKGPDLKLQVWENDGKGNFTLHPVDQGKESHLGCLLSDMDHDGDLDIVSIAWDNYQPLHLWRNDAIRNKK